MAKMQEFIKSNGKSFNESQLEALDNVVKMKKEDFLLIQGPVSIYLFNFFNVAWNRKNSHYLRNHNNAR